MKNIVTKVFITLVAIALSFVAIVYFAPRVINSFGLFQEIIGTESANSADLVTLERVVDGDTIVVQYTDGASATVRLIGIDAPESVHDDPEKNTEEGRVASEYLKSLLIEGQALYLTKDVSNTDKYDRLLRYVWLNPPKEDTSFAQICLNAKLVVDGYAQAKDYPPNSKYSAAFAELEEAATKEGRGVSYLWAGMYSE